MRRPEKKTNTKPGKNTRRTNYKSKINKNKKRTNIHRTSNDSSMGTWIRNTAQDPYRHGCWDACVDIGNTTYIFRILLLYPLCFFPFDFDDYSQFHCCMNFIYLKCGQITSTVQWNRITFYVEIWTTVGERAAQPTIEQWTTKSLQSVDRFSRVRWISVKSFCCIFYIIIWSFDW